MTPDDEKSDEQSEGEPGSSRRNFLKIALSLSVLLAASGVLSVVKAISSPAPTALTTETTSTGQGTSSSSPFPRYKVANLSEITLNKPISFNYPLDDEPNVLVKLGQKAEGGVGPDGDLVAFSQLCQHLGCVFGYTRTGASPSCDSTFAASGPVGYCCCHGSVFDLANGGKVIGGPSPRPAPQVLLEVDSAGDVYAVGMGGPSVFGHDTGSSDPLADLQGGAPVA